MSPMPEHNGAETVRWSITGVDHWEAHVAGALIGSIVSTFEYARVYAVALTGGELGGTHSSLENAKAQLEGWARWQGRLPFTP